MICLEKMPNFKDLFDILRKWLIFKWFHELIFFQIRNGNFYTTKIRPGEGCFSKNQLQKSRAKPKTTITFQQ